MRLPVPAAAPLTAAVYAACAGRTAACWLLQLMLLVNLTVEEQGCEHLLQLGRQGMEGLHM
jgi:hypothetical protein